MLIRNVYECVDLIMWIRYILKYVGRIQKIRLLSSTWRFMGFNYATGAYWIIRYNSGSAVVAAKIVITLSKQF